MIYYNIYPDCENRDKLIQLICNHHDIQCFEIGKSLCSRRITALHIGNPDQKALICGGIHGTEYLTVLACLKFAEYCAEHAEALQTVGVTIVPCVNPDGTEIAINGISAAGCYKTLAAQICPDKSKWKANARGVDINHNFNANWDEVKQREIKSGVTSPSCTRYGGRCPESEPETQALVKLCGTSRYERVLALHSQGREIYWDFGSCTPTECLILAERLSAVSGYAVSTPEPIATGGGFKDWFIQKFHRCGLTVEMGMGENPLPLSDFEAEYPTVQRILWEFIN